MKKFITLASAGLLLFSLQGARAQKEVEPPAVPPMLEGNKPLAQPETREPAAPKQTEAGKAKPKAKTTVKAKARQEGPEKGGGQESDRQATCKSRQEKKPEKPKEKAAGSSAHKAGRP